MMTGKNPSPLILTHREAFLDRVATRLGAHPTDFQGAYEGIRASGKAVPRQKAAGVLLPLFFREASSGNPQQGGQFTFQLIKRSALVPQPGDLSCPGGMLNPLMDGFLRFMILHAPLPLLKADEATPVAGHGPLLHRIITLFLTNAVRESWEETGLSPFHVRFLGPLPTYALQRFARTIFPLVGYVTAPWKPRLSKEVERIVEIPISSFYRDELFGCLLLSFDGSGDAVNRAEVRHPCLILRDSEGKEEILWGATLWIIVRFLEIVMEYQLPSWQDGPVIKRSLSPDYLTGSRASRKNGFRLTGGPSST